MQVLHMVRARGDDETATANGTQRPAATANARAIRKHAFLVVAFEGARPFDAPSRHWLTGLAEVAISRLKRAEGAHSDPSSDDPAGARSVTRNGEHLRVRVSDRLLSAGHARLRRDGNRWVVEDRVIAEPAGKPTANGTFVNGRRVERRALVDQDVIVLGRTAFVFREAELDEEPRPDVTAGDDLGKAIETLSPALNRLNDVVERVAESDLPIVIMGETGTGKEVLAQAIHRRSRRKACVEVDCGAIAANVIESELFGHVKDAFTGANEEREGLFMAAHRGTLLLDEIGELPLEMQPKLLRVLQEGKVRSVGATVARPVDVRVVAATNRDLPALVADQRFRADLWARLNVVSLILPPLRARKEDLGLMLAHLLRRHAAPALVSFNADAVRALFTYRWPENVRGLENVVERALRLVAPTQRQRLAGGASPVIEIRVEHLPHELQSVAPERDSDDDRLDDSPQGTEKARLIALLAKHRGKVRAVANQWPAPGGGIGISEQAIREKCKKYGLPCGQAYARSEGC